MSRRRLSPDERTLWKGVTRSIAPLRPRRDDEPESSAPPAVEAPAKTRIKARPAARVPVSTPAKAPSPPALAPLGRRFKQRLGRGTEAIDAKLDLHGMTQARAHDALLGFLRSSQARGARTVLVITGKGARESGGDGYGDRGVLRRQVPMWLRLPEFRVHVVGIEQAGIGHGGEGALYVRLRKGRRD
jgi:DNA-nicking Smr family endonuclease